MGIPDDQQGPEDRVGPLGIPNVLAYAMGINPLEATPDDLPRLHFSKVGGETQSFGSKEEIFLVYRKNTNALNVEFWFESSNNLEVWEPAKPESEQILSEEHGIEIREARFGIQGIEKQFTRIRTEQTD